MKKKSYSMLRVLASTCRTVAPLRPAPRVVTPSGMSTRWSRSLATNCSASVADKVNAAKTWDLQSCLEDHAQTFVRLPKILGAYVGPNAIEPDLNGKHGFVLAFEQLGWYADGFEKRASW